MIVILHILTVPGSIILCEMRMTGHCDISIILTAYRVTASYKATMNISNDSSSDDSDLPHVLAVSSILYKVRMSGHCEYHYQYHTNHAIASHNATNLASSVWHSGECEVTIPIIIPCPSEVWRGLCPPHRVGINVCIMDGEETGYKPPPAPDMYFECFILSGF